MHQTIYKFNPTKIRLENDRTGQVVQVRDYFEFYTTGIETVPFKNEGHYFETQRFESERTDVLAYQMLESEDLSDVILAINNDVYLWDAPMSYDLSMKIVDNKINILRYNFYREDDQKLPSYTKKYWEELFIKEMEISNDIQKNIIIPKFEKVQRVIRDIRRYLDKRKVK